MSNQDDKICAWRAGISVTLSDTSEILIEDTNPNFPNPDRVSSMYPRGFISKVDGAVFIEPVGNAVGKKFPFPIIAGIQYAISFRKIYATGASTITNHDIIAFR